MSPLTILRIEKLKTFGNVAGSDDHVTRNRETPNADPTKENVRLIGGENSRSLEEIVKEKSLRSSIALERMQCYALKCFSRHHLNISAQKIHLCRGSGLMRECSNGRSHLVTG